MIADKYNMANWNQDVGKYKPKLWLMIKAHLHWTLFKNIITEHFDRIVLQNIVTE